METFEERAFVIFGFAFESFSRTRFDIQLSPTG